MPLPLPVVPVVAPDFLLCDSFYGFLPIMDCVMAGNKIPSTMALAHYDTSYIDILNAYDRDFDYASRLIYAFGTCEIQLNIAPALYGPWSDQYEHEFTEFDFVPEELRKLAGWVINQCVLPKHMGGFATFNISNMMSYISDPANTPRPWPKFPLTSTFFTVTVRRATGGRLGYPGDLDPAVGQAIFESINTLSRETPSDNCLWRGYLAKACLFGRSFLAMNRGSPFGWWGQPEHPDGD